MLHFPTLERFGITACLTEKSDGDATRDGCRALFPERKDLVLLQQVHQTNSVVSAPENDDAVADAIIVREDAPAAVIRVSDCVPVWLFDPEARVGAVIHAGREGTRQEIVAVTVDTLVRDHSVMVERLHAVIGPSAGPCCYEVSEAMAVEFEAAGGVREGRMLDLWATNRDQLAQSGVLPANVSMTTLCTICCGRFHSYRGQKTSARNAAFLEISRPADDSRGFAH